MSDNPLTYEIAEQNPERYQILKNGAIYDHSVGHIKAIPGGGYKAITKANSSELRKSWEDQKIKAAIAAQTGMTMAVGSDNQFDAWSRVNEEQTKLAIDTSKGQTSTKAAEFVGKAAGFLSDRRSNQDNPAQTNVQINLGLDVIERLEGILRVNDE